MENVFPDENDHVLYYDRFTFLKLGRCWQRPRGVESTCPSIYGGQNLVVGRPIRTRQSIRLLGVGYIESAERDRSLSEEALERYWLM
ncbi:hypothetical protein [Spirosoma sp. KUDC1026]|uniref:hypothetical protein n=1 Tax=Spirosoma sp. KUDC1026 TaxID=2745947 RepID=UPI00159BC829|nr:hypothetical protein [Spirosoma sp. KUDC1026]QKZ15270.1 hypothetical protein HU175_22650 [Spirosoma sp. KUDC1026]